MAERAGYARTMATMATQSHSLASISEQVIRKISHLNPYNAKCWCDTKRCTILWGVVTMFDGGWMAGTTIYVPAMKCQRRICFHMLNY